MWYIGCSQISMGRCFWVLFIGFAFFLQRLHIHPWIVCLLYFKQSEHQNLIVDAGALSHLVDLLKRHNSGCNARAVNGLIRRAADAITNLAHENSRIKTLVRFVSICLSLWKPHSWWRHCINFWFCFQNWRWYSLTCWTAWVLWRKGTKSSCWCPANPCI